MHGWDCLHCVCVHTSDFLGLIELGSEWTAAATTDGLVKNDRWTKSAMCTDGAAVNVGMYNGILPNPLPTPSTTMQSQLITRLLTERHLIALLSSYGSFIYKKVEQK